ncbi:MAG: phosphatidylglycerophosphatase A [Phycisphaerae bacterium]
MSRVFNQPTRWIVRIGAIGPLGYLPASGTATVALVGIPVFALTRDCPVSVYLVGLAIFTAGSIWIHDVGDRILGEKDSRKLVWDELAGFFLAVLLVPFTWQLALLALLLERTLDISKVPPANWVENRVPGGWGVVGDDLIAGLYTCLLLHAACHYFPGVLGLTG